MDFEWGIGYILHIPIKLLEKIIFWSIIRRKIEIKWVF